MRAFMGARPFIALSLAIAALALAGPNACAESNGLLFWPSLSQIPLNQSAQTDEQPGESKQDNNAGQWMNLPEVVPFADLERDPFATDLNVDPSNSFQTPWSESFKSGSTTPERFRPGYSYIEIQTQKGVQPL